MEFDWDDVPLIISRTGWSSELGYGVNRDATLAEWRQLVDAWIYAAPAIGWVFLIV